MSRGHSGLLWVSSRASDIQAELAAARILFFYCVGSGIELRSSVVILLAPESLAFGMARMSDPTDEVGASQTLVWVGVCRTKNLWCKEGFSGNKEGLTQPY